MVGIQTENITVNDGPLTGENSALLQPSDPSLPLEELRQRYEEDGYLFLKGVIPREEVLQARKEYFSLLECTGILKPGSKPVEGVFDPAKNHEDYPGIGAGAADGNGRPGGENATKFVDLALDAHYQDWYAETFCKNPSLYNFVARFSGWDKDTLGLRRTLLRNNLPGSKPIGVHYDQIFLRHGDPTSITAWVPIGDIKINGGGLIYLEKGDALGIELEQNFYKTAKEAGLSDEEAKNAFNSNMMATGLLSEFPAGFAKENNRKWLMSAFEAGDVVLHKPHMIHASTVNNDSDNVIRLATDLRFCDSSKPYDTRWMNHYRFADGV